MEINTIPHPNYELVNLLRLCDNQQNLLIYEEAMESLDSIFIF